MPIELRINADSWATLPDELIKLWPQIITAAEDYLTQHTHRAPDRLRIYIRPDHGAYYIALDGKKPFYGEVAKLNCLLLAEEWDNLPDADGDAVAFERESTSILACARHALAASLASGDAKRRVESFCALRHVYITATQFDDSETEQALLRA